MCYILWDNKKENKSIEEILDLIETKSNEIINIKNNNEKVGFNIIFNINGIKTYFEIFKLKYGIIACNNWREYPGKIEQNEEIFIAEGYHTDEQFKEGLKAALNEIRLKVCKNR